MLCGAGVRGGVKKTVELSCGYGDSGDSIKSLKEYSMPLLLIFATILFMIYKIL
jgi:hypothetical protein